MRGSRTVAIATGVMIGLGAIAPAANAQAPVAVTASVVAVNGQGWGVDEARREFRADLRQARLEFRAELREARREFREDIRDVRQDERAKYREARQALRAAIEEARETFLAAIKAANEAFRASVADEPRHAAGGPAGPGVDNGAAQSGRQGATATRCSRPGRSATTPSRPRSPTTRPLAWRRARPSATRSASSVTRTPPTETRHRWAGFARVDACDVGTMAHG